MTLTFHSLADSAGWPLSYCIRREWWTGIESVKDSWNRRVGMSTGSV